MRELPAKLLGAVSDVTIGTAIVIVHALLAERARDRRPQPRIERSKPLRWD